MLTKAQINALFGTKPKGLEWMTDEIGKAFDKKEEIYIDFGDGAEEIDSVMRDGYNKKVTFFYMFGNDRRSITLWESDNPTFSFNATFGCYQMNPIRQKREVKDNKTTTTLDLDGFFEHCEATLSCGNRMPIQVDGDEVDVLSIDRDLASGDVTLKVEHGRYSHVVTQVVFEKAGEWEFTREYPGIGQASNKPWVVKQKAPINKGCFGREFLKEVGLELKKFGSQAKIRIGDDTYHFVSASVNQAADRMTAYVSSNLGTTDHFIFPMSMQWNFDKKFGAWVPDFLEDVIYPTLDIILELNRNRNATHYVSGIQMKYVDSARVPIIKGAIFRFSDKHGNVKVFHSTPETKLRVIKLGDETQLHLEHARKMKFD